MQKKEWVTAPQELVHNLLLGVIAAAANVTEAEHRGEGWKYTREAVAAHLGAAALPLKRYLENPPDGTYSTTAEGATPMTAVFASVLPPSLLQSLNELTAVLRALPPAPLKPQDDWIEHYGRVVHFNDSGCPVPPGTHVQVRFRDGEMLETVNPEQMRWPWSRPYRAAADIVAWRLV